MEFAIGIVIGFIGGIFATLGVAVFVWDDELDG